MPIVTTIKGQPAFSTIAEALSHGRNNGFEGYHIYMYKPTTGSRIASYIAGKWFSKVASTPPATSGTGATTTTSAGS